VQHFADRIIAGRGVRYGRMAMVPTSAKMKRRPKVYLTIETPVVASRQRVNMRKASLRADVFHFAPNIGYSAVGDFGAGSQ
jgi:hypothetical protein